jgi:hypothetical protein
MSVKLAILLTLKAQTRLELKLAVMMTSLFEQYEISDGSMIRSSDNSFEKTRLSRSNKLIVL